MFRRGKKELGDFTEGALFVKILLFTLPIMATVFLQLLFNTADTAMVGRWGGDTPEEREIALAAVGSCGSLVSFIVNLFMGLSNGVGICVSQDVGAKKYDAVARTVHTAFLLAAVSSCVVMAVGLIFARPLLALMGTDVDVMDSAVLYMRAYFLGIPASMIYNYCAAAVRSSGDSKRPLFFIMVGGALNVVFNFVAVVLLRWGAMGVGLATALSQWVSCVMILWHMTGNPGVCRLEWKRLAVDFQKLKQILILGVPIGITGSLYSFSNVQVQVALNSLGKVAVAGNTAASNIEGYVGVIHNSIDASALTFSGQNLGARKKERVKKSLLYCVLMVIVADLLVGGLMLAFGRPLINFFAPGNQAVIDAGMVRLLWLCPTLLLCGIMSLMNAAARGLGGTVGVMASTLIISAGSRVLWIYTAFAYAPTLDVLFASYPVSWLAGAIGSFVCYVCVYRRLRKRNLL